MRITKATIKICKTCGASTLESWALSHDGDEMHLHSGSHRPQAHAFYQWLGYQVDKTSWFSHDRFCHYLRSKTHLFHATENE
jgi:hypothetical protein